MSANIVTVDEESLRKDIKNLVRKTVEETLNALLDEEASELVGAGRYERTAGREAYRSGHYARKLVTGAGEVELNVPKLRGATFQTAVIERYRRRETSVEEAIVEMYLAGVSTRRIEDVSELLWGAPVSSGTVSNLNEKAFASIEAWRQGGYPYVFVDGIYLKRSWGGSYENVAVLVAIGVNSAGDREVIGCAEGYTESADSWREFLSWLKGRGLSGVRLVTGDKCAEEVADELESMRLGAAAGTVRDGFAETLAYTEFPPEHWRRIRTNNGIERINREIRRRTRVVGTFPDGNSALMLVTARLKYIVEHEWGKRRYLDMSKLEEMDELKEKAEG